MKKILAKNLKKGDIVMDNEGLFFVYKNGGPYGSSKKRVSIFYGSFDKIRDFTPNNNDEYILLENNDL